MTDFPKDSLELLAYHPESIRGQQAVWRRAIWRTGRHYRELSFVSKGSFLSTSRCPVRATGPILMLRERFTDAPIDDVVVIENEQWIYLTGPLPMENEVECVRERQIMPCQWMDVPTWEALVADPVPTLIRFALL